MKTAGKKKITVGFVIQTFDEHNKCIEQEFVAGDQVDYEDAEGNRMDAWSEYRPFDMVQPQAMAVVLVGNLSDGFKAIGPFTDFDEAVRAVAETDNATPFVMESPYEAAETRISAATAHFTTGDYVGDGCGDEERLNELKARLDAVKQSHKTVPCKFCHKQVPAATAHAHDGDYVGDECCWDERLRPTE